MKEKYTLTLDESNIYVVDNLKNKVISVINKNVIIDKYPLVAALIKNKDNKIIKFEEAICYLHDLNLIGGIDGE